MQHNNLLFHNVEELQDRGPLGLHLQRFPARVRQHPETNELARLVMQKAMGSEIRFVTEAPRIRISVAALEQDNQVVILKGDFAVGHYRIPAGQTVHLLVNRPETYDYVRPEYFQDCRFSPEVWRIWSGQEGMLFLGLDTFGADVRPPMVTEVPRARWMAYGSSFTMGGGAFSHFNNYVDIAARLLKVDGINLGLGGSCHAEFHVADYLATRTDWDFCTLRIGINMIGVIEPPEYRRRVEYLLDTLAARQPDKPVLLIGLGLQRIRHSREIKIWQKHTLAYHQINQEIMEDRKGRANLHFCTEDDLSPNPTLVRADQLHPDDLGYFVIASRLADRLQALGLVHPTPPSSP